MAIRSARQQSSLPSPSFTFRDGPSDGEPYDFLRAQDLDPDPENRFARPGAEIDRSTAARPDDPLDDVQSEARSRTDLFGREEGVEDTRLDLSRYPGTVVGNLHRHLVAVPAGADRDRAPSIDRIDRGSPHPSLSV